MLHTTLRQYLIERTILITYHNRLCSWWLHYTNTFQMYHTSAKTLSRTDFFLRDTGIVEKRSIIQGLCSRTRRRRFGTSRCQFYTDVSTWLCHQIIFYLLNQICAKYNYNVKVWRRVRLHCATRIAR